MYKGNSNSYNYVMYNNHVNDEISFFSSRLLGKEQHVYAQSKGALVWNSSNG